MRAKQHLHQAPGDPCPRWIDPYTAAERNTPQGVNTSVVFGVLKSVDKQAELSARSALAEEKLLNNLRLAAVHDLVEDVQLGRNQSKVVFLDAEQADSISKDVGV